MLVGDLPAEASTWQLPRPGAEPSSGHSRYRPSTTWLEVATAGLGSATHRSGELHHRELRHLRTALAAQGQRLLVPLLDWAHERVTRVQRHPPSGVLHDLTGGVVLGPLLRPSRRQHRGGVICSRELGRVDRGGHRGANTASDHRQSDPEIGVVHKGPENSSRNFAGLRGSSVRCGGLDKLDQRRVAGAFPAEVSRRALHALLNQRPQHQPKASRRPLDGALGPNRTPWNRSQTAGGNPIASLIWASPGLSPRPTD